MKSRKTMIRFISTVTGRSVSDVEIYFSGKPNSYIVPMFEKMQEQAQSNDSDFLAA